jgi:outer membrane lipopolysaccharide assembly protein LptE/RlpB
MRWTSPSLVSSMLVSVVLAGCGYRLVGTATNIPAEVRRVHLKAFENLTGRVQVDQILTRAVADELVARQRFEMLSAAEGADAEIAGSVTAFSVRPVAFDAEGRATEFEIAITAKVSFNQLAPERVIWQNDRYQFRDNYQLESSELGYFDRETPAIEATATKFAETMVTDLLEGF